MNAFIIFLVVAVIFLVAAAIWGVLVKKDIFESTFTHIITDSTPSDKTIEFKPTRSENKNSVDFNDVRHGK